LYVSASDGAGGVAIATVAAEALVPSEKTAVTVSVVPGTNSMSAQSAAKRRKLPPLATGKLTAKVPSRAPSAPSPRLPAPTRSRSLPL
jgi:hypothetical protein